MSIKDSQSPHLTRIVVSIFVGALVLLATLAGVVGARRTAAPTPALPEVGKTSPASAFRPRSRPIANFESELITITPHGFEPRELTRPQGRFLLMIDDRSNLAATSLALTSDAGRRTHEMRVAREEPNWSAPVELPPGHYVLTEADHPRWSCRITITAP